MEAGKAVVCGKEAVELLNCVAESKFDQDRCLHLMQSLRQCILSKKVKKFSLPEEKQPEGEQSSKMRS